MKKRLVIFGLLCMFPALLNGQELFQSFDDVPDSSTFYIEVVGSSDTSSIFLSQDTNQFAEGMGSMEVNWTTQATESWGGFSKFEYWNPDTMGVWDLSPYTHLSFWYYVTEKASVAGQVEFRLELYEVSDAPVETYSASASEFYYSHLQILEAEPGWNEILMPLQDVKALTFGEGFWRPGWAGIAGNDELNLDKIKGFGFEISQNGSLHDGSNQANSGVVTGTFLIDGLRGVGHAKPVVNFFDDAAQDTTISYAGTGASSITLTDNGDNALEDAAMQVEYSIDATEPFGGFVNMQFNPDEFLPDMAASTHLSVWFNNTSASDMPGNAIFRMQLLDQSEGAENQENWYYETNVMLDSEPGWQRLLIPLEDRGPGIPPSPEGFSRPGWAGAPGNDKLDWDKVKGYTLDFVGLAQGTVTTGTILFDNLELFGTRETDFTAPDAPSGVSAIADNFFNIVFWQDVAGEEGEKYTVYASTSEITDVTAPNVEILGEGLPEGDPTLVHYLNSPLMEQDITYYYAVTATDKAGNVSAAGTAASAVTNKAMATPTIALSPFTNFAADGDFSEWASAGVTPFVLSSTTAYNGLGTFDNDDDLTATIYMAVDNEYLYIAAEVIDNVYSFAPEGNWWQDDAIELFFGLYDSRGAKHSGAARGEEPDYSLQLRADGLVNAYDGNNIIYTADSSDYYHEALDPDWIIETRIKLTDLQIDGDTPFVPQNGMRIPFDVIAHDADADDVRDGILSFSRFNNDNSWQSPRNWEYTWVGDQDGVTTSVDDPVTANIPGEYTLSQNYPNPFNPVTHINFTIPQQSHVKIELFNALGQRVQTLLDGATSAGQHMVVVNGAELTSGVYFYRISADRFQQTRKMILMK